MVALLKGEQALLHSGNIRNDNWLQRVLLSWVYGVVYKGKVQKLDPSELKMPSDQATDVALQTFDKYWQEELELQKQGKQASLARALRRSYGKEFLIAGTSTASIILAHGFCSLALPVRFDQVCGRCFGAAS
jgi:hypothetical protein